MSFVYLAVSIILLSLLARASGGGLGAHVLNKKGEIDQATGLDKGGVMPFSLTMLPEILFGLCLASPLLFTGHWFLWLLVGGWRYAWMETGHGIAYHMGRVPDQDPNRKQRLSVVVDWLAPKLGLQPFTRAWCWLFMGIKGFLIGVGCFPAGSLLAVLWPLAYDLGWTLKERGHIDDMEATEFAEYCSGAFAGVVLGLSLTF